MERPRLSTTEADRAGAPRVAMSARHWPVSCTGRTRSATCQDRRSGCACRSGQVVETPTAPSGREVPVPCPMAQSDDVLSGHISSLLVRTAGPPSPWSPRSVGVQATSPDLPYRNIDPMPQLAWQPRAWRSGRLCSARLAAWLLLAAVGCTALSYVVSRASGDHHRAGGREPQPAGHRGPGLVTLAGLVSGSPR
jgi:hypothetical protein